MIDGTQDRRGPSEQVSVLVPGEETQERFALLEVVVRRSDESPLHTHTLEDEVIYVVRGEVTIYLDGTQLRCTEGTCVVLPRGSEHICRAESDEATLLVLLMPAGLETWYQELAGSSGSVGHIERLIAASARYGVKIMGPGPSAPRHAADCTRISEARTMTHL